MFRVQSLHFIGSQMMLSLSVAASLFDRQQRKPQTKTALDQQLMRSPQLLQPPVYETPLSQCGQLSPAGTGSQTLSNTLHALRGSSVHSHHEIPDAPCYVMTLRDLSETQLDAWSPVSGTRS